MDGGKRSELENIDNNADKNTIISFLIHKILKTKIRYVDPIKTSMFKSSIEAIINIKCV